MFQSLRDKIRGSMALKFSLALSGWIAALMLVGTVFVTRMLMTTQERAIEARGRELGIVLGKATVDRLISNDLMGLNLLVADVVKYPDIVYVIFYNVDGSPLTNARASFNATNGDVRAIIEREKTDDVQKLASTLRHNLNPIEVPVDIQLEGSKLAQIRLAFTRSEILKNAKGVALLLLGTSAAIVLSLSALLYFMVRKMILVPASQAEAIANKIAGGDLTESVRVSTVDEVGNLGRGLNRMIIGLREIVGKVRSTSGSLEAVSAQVAAVSANVAAASKVQFESVEEAASSVNEMHFSLKEIAATVEDLSTTSEQTSSAVIETAASIDEVARIMNDLSSSIEETSTAIEQMFAAVKNIAENIEMLSSAADQTAASANEVNASVREVETNAKQSAELAEAVAADAKHLGMLSIEKTMEGMQRIEEESRRSAEVINRLENRAENIGGILTVIEDITDQTSLLALNAAILAAQAGEHGKGFAVVAAEIRDLANRTAASTQEIGALIQSVQEEAKDAVAVIQKGVDLAAEGTRLARETSSALRKIVERSDQSYAMSRNISKAAEEQSTSIRLVNDSVARITEMAHQIAKAVAEQRSGSEQIAHAAERMREITRFVKSATNEQVKASKSITEAVENMSTRVSLVSRASGELRTGSDLIVKAIERIKSTARENAALAEKLSSAVDVLTQQAAVFKKEIERFTMGKEET